MAGRANGNEEKLDDRMDVLRLSQNEVARRARVSSAHLSSIMSGKANPSPGVLRRLHGVLFQRTKAAERVMPAEVKVLGVVRRAFGAGWWCVALVAVGVRSEAALFGLAVVCRGVRRWNTLIVWATTAGGGCR